MLFLDQSYFQGELSLPMLVFNQGPSVGNAKILQSVGQQSLNWFIVKYETVYLEELLGLTLYQSLLNGLEEPDPNPIWIELRDRIFRKEGTIGFSPAAGFVYFFAMRDGRTQTTAKGEVRSKSSYSDDVFDGNKMVKAWNDMVDQSLMVARFLKKNWTVYREYAGQRDCFRMCTRIFSKINSMNI